MSSNTKRNVKTQSGFTLIEMMIVIAIVGILAAIGIASYQLQVRKTHLITIYQELNHFRLPYQTLIDEGAGVTDFSPNGLNMPDSTKYCQFGVTAPHINAITRNAVICHIQNLSYLSSQSMSLERSANGSWQCTPSSGIPKSYLPKACQ